ncbi:MAG: phage terminase large subunit [Acholeplasmatales bacterium]|jgi:PBSX family phage terminase large subunit|nr:phage terminase large subunit [Acholeplasmatales bacterium]
MENNKVQVWINPKIKDLFFNKKTRHNVLFGGRGSGKSWGICDCLIIDAIQHPNQIIPCLREFQVSIKKSSYSQVKANLEAMVRNGLNIGYRCLNNSIVLDNGSTFLFFGISDSTGTDQSVKSMYTENVRNVWVEEAQRLKDDSLRLLKNTFRKDDCRIFYTMNPQTPVDAVLELAKDTTYCTAVKLNWMDNPKFPLSLQKEREIDEATLTPERYEHDWNGEPYQEGATLINNTMLISQKYETNHNQVLYMGVDIATGEASDTTCYTIASRYKIMKQDIIRETDPRKIAQAIYDVSKEWNVVIINLDKGNIGWAIIKEMKEYLFCNICNGIDFGSTHSIKYNCYNKRTEMYYSLMLCLKNGMDLENMQKECYVELTNTMLDIYNSHGKIKLVEKKLIKQKLGRSPDRADSFALCFATDILTTDTNINQSTILKGVIVQGVQNDIF